MSNSQDRTPIYNARKSAQMAAVFARQQGGTINVLKLMKLLYLADRESMKRSGFPISFDHAVSMDHGPVLSTTLNLINGAVLGSGGALWEEWISGRQQNDLSLRRTFDRNDLDQLSDADLEVLEDVGTTFGTMDQWTLVDYVHKHCPEWEDPQGSSIPIDPQNILLALGKSDAESQELASSIKAQRLIDRLPSSG